MTATPAARVCAGILGCVALGLGFAFALPVSPATAQCPGCDEYTFDLPDSEGDEPVPEPTAPTAPVAPAAPVEPTYVPPAEVPVAPTEPEPPPDPEKPRAMVDARSEQGLAPIALTPIDTASAVSPEGSSVLPLALVVGAATVLAVGIGLRRQARAD